MKNLKEAQIIWLKIELPYFGIFDDAHPYLVLHIDWEEYTVEIGQFHSVEGKGFEAISETNTVIYNISPEEPALPKTSFLQLNNTIKLELFEGISNYKRTEEKLSERKFNKAVRKYDKYHDEHEILDDHIIYMDKIRIQELN